MIFFKKSILKTHSLSVRQCAFSQERRRRICSDNRGTEGLPLQRKKKHSRWKKPTAAMILYYEIPVMPSWAISMVSIAISDAAALKSGALYFIGHALITCHEAAGDYASSSSVM